MTKIQVGDHVHHTIICHLGPFGLEWTLKVDPNDPDPDVIESWWGELGIEMLENPSPIDVAFPLQVRVVWRSDSCILTPATTNPM